MHLSRTGMAQSMFAKEEALRKMGFPPSFHIPDIHFINHLHLNLAFLSDTRMKVYFRLLLSLHA